MSGSVKYDTGIPIVHNFDNKVSNLFSELTDKEIR